MGWQQVLEEVLAIVYRPLEVEQVRWALVGSAASALQGCEVIPRDIDFLTVEPAGVYRFAELMAGYVAPPGASPDPFAGADWWSTAEEPVSAGPDDYGFTWHFGRWAVGGVRVEVAHLVAPAGFPTSADGAGIWEAGPEIWPHVYPRRFAGYDVPVVPLEIQLQTNLQRGLEARAEEIVAVLRRNGYDRALLQKSLSRKHLQLFERLVQGDPAQLLS